MTKKHFEAIAATIAAERAHCIDHDDAAGVRTLDALAKELAYYFQTVNGLFDHARFLRACRGEA